MREREVLFPRGTEFEVISREWNPADNRLDLTIREKTAETGDEQFATVLNPDAEAPTPSVAEQIGVIKAHQDNSGPGPAEPASHKDDDDCSAGHNTPDPTPDPGTADGGAGDDHRGDGADRGGGREGDPNGPPGDHDMGDGHHEPEPTGEEAHKLPDLTAINNEFRDSGGFVRPERFDEWTRRVSDAYPEITARQVETIYNFTCDHFGDINSYLRDRDPLSPSEIDRLYVLERVYDRPVLGDMIDHLDHLVASLPTYRADPSDAESTTYRGVAATDSLLAQMQVGNTFRDPAYFSTSTEVEVATKHSYPIYSGTPLMLTVIGRSGVDISPLGGWRREKEVLFPRGTEFEIISREWRASDKWVSDDETLWIVMREKTASGS